MKNNIKIILIFSSFLMMDVLFFGSLNAAVMQSTNYQIQSDNLTPSGGQWSSVNYIFKDSFGEVSTGISDSTSYSMRAGYQEMQETYLSISSPGVLNMTPSIPGISGGTADVSGTFNVITDDAAGFTLALNASTAHAMMAESDPTYYFSNYSATPTYTWTVYSGNAQFGYTVEPESYGDTVIDFLDDTSNNCGTGDANGTGTCWAGFDGTDLKTVIYRTTRTDIDGEDEVVKFRAQSSDYSLESGTYTATITATAYSN
jgi:hypothetical protein